METRTIGYKWYRFIFYFNSENIPYKLELLDNNKPNGEVDLLNDEYAITIGLIDLLRKSKKDLEKKLDSIINKEITNGFSYNDKEDTIDNEYSEKMQSFFEYILEKFKT